MERRFTRRTVHRYGLARPEAEVDSIVDEYPFTVHLNGEEVATLLCTPDHLDALAVGFLYFEGLIRSREDVQRLEIDEETGIARIEANVPPLATRLYNRRTVGSGCGNNGLLYRAADALGVRPIASDLRVPASRFNALMTELQRRAPLFQETGGAHCAALADPAGIRLLCEDIGRHNAVDKIVGECILRDLPIADRILLSTGRISSDMLIKAAKLGVPILASRSAPTALAVGLGDELGVTVVGFVRSRRLNIYSHPERIERDLPAGGEEPKEESVGWL